MDTHNTLTTAKTTNMERKALIITNPGLIDTLAFELIGASTKRGDDQTIGFFGSGLKYAIAGLLRRNIPFQVWRGEELLDITTEEVTMRDQTFNRIHFNGSPTSLTTEMGPKWEKWMLIRELYANAIDEGGEMAVDENYQQYIKEGRTTIVFPDLSELEEVVNDQEILFCRGREVVYEDDAIRLYEEIGDGGLYVKGILVSRRGPGFGYMHKKKPYDLNEERQLSSAITAHSDTLIGLFNMNDRRMVKRLASRAKTIGTLERSLLHDGYLLRKCKASEAWSDIILFKEVSKDFATEWNHLVVSDDIYDNVESIRKWENRKWTRIGSDKQNAKLHAAIRLIEQVAPGELPQVEWSFASSDSKTLGMGIEGGMGYVCEKLAAEPVPTIAAHVVLSLGQGKMDIALMSRFFQAQAA